MKKRLNLILTVILYLAGIFLFLGTSEAATIYVDKDNKFGNGCNNSWPGTINQPKCDVDANWFRYDL